MRALVIYESMFGNTKLIAEAIAQGLSTHLPVDAIEVAEAPSVLRRDVGLVVAGGPTHAFGMSRARTRGDAADRATEPLVSKDMGVREWLAALNRPEAPIVAAAFDTRVSKPRVPGSAARAIARRLRRLGFRLVAKPETFWVTGMTGPLLDDELKRARGWGETLGAEVTGAHSSRVG